MPIVYSRNCPATWSASLYRIGNGPQNYGTLLEEFPKGHGDIVTVKHCVSSADKWSVREDHTDFRGHAASMRPRS